MGEPSYGSESNPLYIINMMQTIITYNNMDGNDDKSKEDEKKSVTERYAADPNTAGTGISEIKEKDATPTITTTDPLQVGSAGAGSSTGSATNTSAASNTVAKNNNNIDEKEEEEDQP